MTARPLLSAGRAHGRALALAPDGRLLLFCDRDALRCRDDDDRPVWTAPPPAPDYPDQVVDASWSHDGDEILLLRAGTVDLLDADTGRHRPLTTELPPGPGAHRLAISPDGSRVAYPAERGVAVVHLADGSAHHLPATDRTVDLAWRPGGDVLCRATEHTLQLWDVDGRRLVRGGLRNRSGITAAAWSPDGAELYVADDQGVHRTDGRGGPAVPVARPAGRVLALTVLPDGRVAATVAGEGLSVVDPSGRTPAAGWAGDPRTRGDAVLARCGRLLLNGPRGAELWAVTESGVNPPDRRRGRPLRLWSAAMCASVGRALPGPDGPRPQVERHQDLVAAGTVPGIPDTGWLPTGRAVYLADGPGRLVRRPVGTRTGVPPDQPGRAAGDPGPPWEARIPSGCLEIAVQPTGALLAVSTRNEIGTVRVLRARDGRETARLDGGQGAVWSPLTEPLLAVPEGGSRPATVVLYRLDPDGSVADRQHRPVASGVGRLAWSADGKWLAAGTGGGVVVWDMPAFELRAHATSEAIGLVSRVAWSPDGRYLAAVPASDREPLTVWSTGNWRPRYRLGRSGGLGWSATLAWSPDGSLLAAPGTDGSAVDLWDVAARTVALTLPGPPAEQGTLWSARWSPDGRRLTTAHTAGPVRLWSLRHGRSSAPAAPLPVPAEALADLAVAAAAAGARASLADLAALGGLLRPNPPADLRPLWEHRSAAALRALAWPRSTHPALVGMIAAYLPGHRNTAAPTTAGPRELRDALLWGLGGEGTAVPPGSVSPERYGEALRYFHRELLPLVLLLGPDAVREDPGLARRLLRQPWARSVDAAGRRLPRWGVPGPGRAGDSVDAATGAAAPGELARHGPPQRLLASQLALPGDLWEALLAQDALLYRARRAQPPDRLRPAVLVLDDTPAAHGQVGTALRLFAHLLARRLILAGRGVGLVTLGGPPGARRLHEAGDLAALWSVSAPGPPARDRALAELGVLAGQLHDPVTGPPTPVLLTHPFEPALSVPGAVAVRVHYPDRPVPVREDRCWVLAPTSGPAELLRALDEVFAAL
ncbi:hypothetical protein ACFRAR_08065 [Kitasatospora sp. NPDC056651]|uniref:hypothetical protein n=1 Tax=Kitasatospora sp. NPDC056651 TaxID=3345892 RepID=UPI0036800C49